MKKKRLRDCTLGEIDSYCYEHNCDDCLLKPSDDKQSCDFYRIFINKLDTEIDLPEE